MDNEPMHADEPTTIGNTLIRTLDTTAVKRLFAELSIVEHGHLNRQELFYFALVAGHVGGPMHWEAEYNKLAECYDIAPEGMDESTFQLFLVEWELTACCNDEDLRSWMNTLIGNRLRRRIETYHFMATELEPE